jgi:hypothetical protein
LHHKSELLEQPEVAGTDADRHLSPVSPPESIKRGDAIMRFTCNEVLAGSGFSPAKELGREILYHCPSCHNERPGLSVNRDTDTWFCTSCGKSGTASELTAFIIGVNPDNESATSDLEQRSLSKESGTGPLPQAKREDVLVCEPTIIGPSSAQDDLLSLSPLSPQHKVVIAPEAFHGLAGDIVRMINPHTEADPVAVLINTLVGFGNMVGDGSYVAVGADIHPARINATLVGTSSKSRKGASWSGPKAFFQICDAEWASNRVSFGLSTGEGLISAVIDGDSDKRLLLVESEFSSMLTKMSRAGNSLSGIIRQAWDCGDLSTLTRKNPQKVSGAHVSIIGHTTQEELLRNLKDTELFNGFANRFLWMSVNRSKYLPNPEPLPEEKMMGLGKELIESLEYARNKGMIKRDAEADSLWCHIYASLSDGLPGNVGSILSRGEAQVIRLSLIYALLDKSTCIQKRHILAALAIWDYCVASVLYLFKSVPVGSKYLQGTLAAIRDSANGLTEEEIGKTFGGHKSEQKKEALRVLQEQGLIEPIIKKTGGRPRTTWVLAGKAGKAGNVSEGINYLDLAKKKLSNGELFTGKEKGASLPRSLNGSVMDSAQEPTDMPDIKVNVHQSRLDDESTLTETADHDAVISSRPGKHCRDSHLEAAETERPELFCVIFKEGLFGAAKIADPIEQEHRCQI